LDGSSILPTSTRLAALARGKPPKSNALEGSLLFKTESESSALSERSESNGLACPECNRGNTLSLSKGYTFLNMYWVYMIKNDFNDLYVGITDNPEQRLKYHNEKRGALFTKRDSLFKIVLLEQYPTLADARKREIQIKKWRRDKKEMLIKRYGQGLPTN
jgi:putative endonuclease